MRRKSVFRRIAATAIAFSLGGLLNARSGQAQDFDSNTQDDLVIGIPGEGDESLGTVGSGEVTIMSGFCGGHQLDDPYAVLYIVPDERSSPSGLKSTRFSSLANSSTVTRNPPTSQGVSSWS